MKQALTTGRVLRFYLPLAVNSTLMLIETPVVTAGIARLPDAELQLAAFGMMYALVYTFVNFGVPLIHAGNALGRTRAMFGRLTRFALAVCVFITLLSAAVYFTPAYYSVMEGLLGAPGDVAAAALPGTQMMVAVAFPIAWRRFLDGVLIRHGYTGIVGWCTLIRAATLLGVVAAGVEMRRFSGVQVACAALMLSATVECAVVSAITWLIVRRKGAIRWDSNRSFDLSYGAILRFFLPLAVMLVLTATVRPIISAAMARLPDPVLSLAAFPVAYSTFYLVFSPLYSLPQMVIALVKDGRSYALVSRFVRLACIAGWLFLLLATFSPLIDLYLLTLLGVPANVRSAAIPAVRVMAFYILIAGWQSQSQGVLVAARRTGATQLATSVNVAALALVLAVGVALGGLPGVLVGALAYVLGFAAEAATLRWRARLSVRQIFAISGR